MIKDRIADIMFQQMLLRPEEYDVIATPNLNGDYLSDAVAAEVGGVGIAPGANIGDYMALFEATHGTAPKYADQDKVNPGVVLFSGVMMLDYIGWREAARAVEAAYDKTVADKIVTYDFARQMDGAQRGQDLGVRLGGDRASVVSPSTRKHHTGRRSRRKVRFHPFALFFRNGNPMYNPHQ